MAWTVDMLSDIFMEWNALIPSIVLYTVCYGNIGSCLRAHFCGLVTINMKCTSKNILYGIAAGATDS